MTKSRMPFLYGSSLHIRGWQCRDRRCQGIRVASSDQVPWCHGTDAYPHVGAEMRQMDPSEIVGAERTDGLEVDWR